MALLQWTLSDHLDGFLSSCEVRLLERHRRKETSAGAAFLSRWRHREVGVRLTTNVYRRDGCVIKLHVLDLGSMLDVPLDTVHRRPFSLECV